MRRTIGTLLFAAGSCLAADPWLARTDPVLSSEERKLYKSLASAEERESFRHAFWADKALTESDYLQRLAYIDNAFGSGREGSGANTDQGRLYLANGQPNAVHRLPSSRTFVPCEVWYYDSLPRTGYRSRLQFLFFRQNGIGDFRLYSPQLHTIRALLVPQPGTRLMFPVNDIISPNDIRDRLKTNPGEEELVEAAMGVARGITGSGNGEILARAASPAHMIRRDPTDLRPQVESRFEVRAAPDVRVLQFWASEYPVVDVQVRLKAVSKVGLLVEDRGTRIEQSEIPLQLDRSRSILYTHRFFLLPGRYMLTVTADGAQQKLPLVVSASSDQALIGEAFEEQPGELTLALTPDPRSPEARAAIAWQNARRGDAR